MFCKNLPVSGFEPRTFGIGSDHSVNWATTTAPNLCFLQSTTQLMSSTIMGRKVDLLWNKALHAAIHVVSFDPSDRVIVILN